MKRFIQVGTGGFGAYWCETVIPRVLSFAQPVAAVDVSETALENAATFLNLPKDRCYTSLEKALAEVEADFITVVVPPHAHEAVIDLAIAHGLDIVCEKPLGGDMEACARIYRKVKAAGRKLAVTMSHRLEVEKQTVESMVQSGEYGQLRYLVSRLTMPRSKTGSTHAPTSENPVAALINNALVHNLDTMRGVSGSDVRTVYVSGWTSSLEDFADASSALAILEMENGVRAQLEISSANACGLDGWSDEYLRAECDKGTIIADHRQITVHNAMGFPHPSLSKVPLRKEPYWDHALVLHDFVRWLNGGAPPATHMEENLPCCALTYAAIESALTGQIVDVPAYLARHLA